MMPLSALAPHIAPQHADLMITGLTADSRNVEKGFLFAALPGVKVDGAAFIERAAAAGAVAALGAPAAEAQARAAGLAFVADDEPRLALARMAATFYAPQPENVVAVTGTNGKSSVVEFCRQIWAHVNVKGAALGTLGLKMDEGAPIDFGHTTPDPVGLHKALQQAAKEGVQALALEASSHGLAQYRMDGVQIKAAGFTTLGRDHLDYHATMEDYLAAKLGLFSRVLPEGGVAVVDADGVGADAAAKLKDIAAARGLVLQTIGSAGADYALTNVQPTTSGISAALRVGGQVFELDLPLLGAFQLHNVVMALALVTAAGADLAAAVAAVPNLKGVPGRMEQVAETKTGAAVVVDYAHTPDALETVLMALRPHVGHELHVVFGCGGDRDTGKRPVMGKVAAHLADHVVVTDDNPRSEDASTIRAAILKACPDASEIGDRHAAIAAALGHAKAGDIVLIAGKGHETGQIIGDEVLPFDDRAIAAALAGGAA